MNNTYFTVKFKANPGITLFLSPTMLERLLSSLTPLVAETLIVTQHEFGKGPLKALVN